MPSILTFTLNKNYPFISARPQHFPAAIPLGASLPGVFSWNRISLFSTCPNINLFPPLLFTNFTILIDLRLTLYFILKHELAPRLCHTAHCQDGLLVSDTGFFRIHLFQTPKGGIYLKPKKTDRKSMIMRFLKGSYLYFILAIATSMLYTVFNSLTPQVIRAMVDSIIGTEPFSLPQPVLTLIDQIDGREYPQPSVGSGAGDPADCPMCGYLYLFQPHLHRQRRGRIH